MAINTPMSGTTTVNLLTASRASMLCKQSMKQFVSGTRNSGLISRWIDLNSCWELSIAAFILSWILVCNNRKSARRLHHSGTWHSSQLLTYITKLIQVPSKCENTKKKVQHIVVPYVHIHYKILFPKNIIHIVVILKLTYSLTDLTELTFLLLVFTIYFYVPIILIRHTL